MNIESHEYGKRIVTNYTEGDYRLQVATWYANKVYRSAVYEYRLEHNGEYTFEVPLNNGKGIGEATTSPRFSVRALIEAHSRANQEHKAVA